MRSRPTASKAATDLNNAKAAARETDAEIKRLTEELYRMKSAWTQAGTALTNFSKKCGTLSKAMTKAGKTLTTHITTPIVALGTTAVKASMDFESSFAYVRKTVNGTEEDFNKLADASKRMSTEIATSTDEINAVMATGGQLGIATEHIEEFARVMIDLSNASTDLDADTAATQLAKFANIMGTSQSQFSNIGSTIAMLGNNFATTEAPIAEMAMRIAGAGKQIGLTEAQVLGLATALSSVGIQAQAGGSSICGAITIRPIWRIRSGQLCTSMALRWLRNPTRVTTSQPTIQLPGSTQFSGRGAGGRMCGMAIELRGFDDLKDDLVNMAYALDQGPGVNRALKAGAVPIEQQMLHNASNPSSTPTRSRLVSPVPN